MNTLERILHSLWLPTNAASHDYHSSPCSPSAFLETPTRVKTPLHSTCVTANSPSAAILKLRISHQLWEEELLLFHDTVACYTFAFKDLLLFDCLLLVVVVMVVLSFFWRQDPD